MNKVKSIGLSLAVISALSLGFNGCGSSSSSDTTTSDTANSTDNLDGTFATGKGQEGTILVRGAKGNEVFGLSNSDGTFSIDVSSLTAPYKIKAETVDKDTVFYSYTTSKTYTNINQITTMMLKEATKQDDLAYLFENTELLNEEALEEARTAIKNNLLLQIYSSGLDPDEINIFKDRFDTNKLGHDSLLEKLKDDGIIKTESTLNIEESKDIQRLLSSFFIKDDNGKMTIDILKFSHDTFNSFYTAVVEMAEDKEYMQTIEFEGNSKLKYAVTDAGKDFLTGMVLSEIKQLFIESFGTLLNLSDADKEFVTQLSSVAFKNNIFDVVSTMYRGIKGEDTSTLYNPLLEALHNSTLGNPVVAAEKLNDFIAVDGTISSVICKIPILNIGREESCQYIENKIDENNENSTVKYTIDFNDYKTIEVTPNQTSFQVTSISPNMGTEATEFDMNNQAILVEFNQDLYQGLFSDIAETTTAKMNVLNLNTNEPITCDKLKLLEGNKILCSFDNNQIEYNSKYAFSVTAENADRNESLSIISTFTTPSYLVNNIEISKESGKYNDSVDISITIPDGYEIYYTLNSRDLSKKNAVLYTEGALITIDKTSALRVVAYKGNNKVSPLIRKIYNIVVTPIVPDEEIKQDEIPTPIDTSTLTVSVCQEKTVNTTFETNTWTTSLTEWNDVHLACLPILAGISNDDSNTDNDTTTDNSNITSLSYMRTHSTEKLSSNDCKAYAGGSTVSLEWVGSNLSTPIEDIKGWGDVKGVLAGDLAPSSNMMTSIYACDKAQQMVASGQVNFKQAINSVNTMSEPFSDSPSVSGFPTGGTTVPDTSTDASSSTGTLTLSQCETDYGHYTTSEWAQNAGDSRVAACNQALILAPMIGMDGQPYIDAYNAGSYN